MELLLLACVCVYRSLKVWNFERSFLGFENMEVGGSLTRCVGSKIHSPVPLSPTSSSSARIGSPRTNFASNLSSPTGASCEDFSFGASFSGRKVPAQSLSPNFSGRRKVNLTLQVGAFYSESSASSTCSEESEEQQSSTQSPKIPPMVTPKRNFYEILGVGRNASPKEIRSAYRSKALDFHPDVANPAERQRFTELFTQINEAYTTLADPHSRSLYDAKISYNFAANYEAPVGAPHVPGFNSYAYDFSGFSKTDIWARNSSVKSTDSAASPRASYAAPVNAVPKSNSFSSQTWRGRNWETDQCWC